MTRERRLNDLTACGSDRGLDVDFSEDRKREADKLKVRKNDSGYFVLLRKLKACMNEKGYTLLPVCSDGDEERCMYP